MIPMHVKTKKMYPDEELVASALDDVEVSASRSMCWCSVPASPFGLFRMQEYEEEDLYAQNSQVNSLSPVSNNAHIVNWNDYGYALVPLVSDQGPQIKNRSPERISFNMTPWWFCTKCKQHYSCILNAFLFFIKKVRNRIENSKIDSHNWVDWYNHRSSSLL